MEQLTFTPETGAIWDTCLARSGSDLPFYTYGWHEQFFDTVGNNRTPEILYDPDRSVIAPFGISGRTAVLSGGKEIADYQDIIGPDTEKAAIWPTILSRLISSGIRNLSLPNIPETSPTLAFFRALKEQGHPDMTIVREDSTPKMPLPATFAAYTGSLDRKQRHELERKIRKFEREYPDTKDTRSSDQRNDIAILLNLMRQDERKIAFLTPEYEAFFRSLPGLFQHSLELQILYIGHNPVSSLLGFRSGKTFLLYNSGFDRSRYPGAGFYHKAASIRRAIENGYTEYNFLQGTERYKYELGGRDYGVYTVSVAI